ncbi:MAG: TlpA family protein disulfide reductase [Candidatus Heimdallarchaeota archaeon]|nr:TlpA family protein disulfide reductase [Candidatus Heimdallarchaeota archaeon]
MILPFVLLLVNVNVLGYQINFSYLDLNGLEQSYSQFQGKPLLVDAFATTCEPCKTEILHIQEIQKIVGNNVSILTLSIDKADSSIEIRNFRDEFGATWQFASDNDGEFLTRYDTPLIPTLYLFDPEGNLVEEWFGITEPALVLDKMNSLFGSDYDLGERPSYNDFVNQLTSSNLFRITIVFVLISVVYLAINPDIWRKLASSISRNLR